MNLEIRDALRVDLRKLVGTDPDADVDNFPVDDAAELAEGAQAGYESVDHIIRISVRPNAKSELEAKVNVRSCILCMYIILFL